MRFSLPATLFPIEFADSLKTAKDLGDIVETDGSYLNTWDIYLDKEGNVLLEKAKQIGILKILNSSRVDDGYELRISSPRRISSLTAPAAFSP